MIIFVFELLIKTQSSADVWRCVTARYELVMHKGRTTNTFMAFFSLKATRLVQKGNAEDLSTVELL